MLFFIQLKFSLLIVWWKGVVRERYYLNFMHFIGVYFSSFGWVLQVGPFSFAGNCFGLLPFAFAFVCVCVCVYACKKIRENECVCVLSMPECSPITDQNSPKKTWHETGWHWKNPSKEGLFYLYYYYLIRLSSFSRKIKNC